MNGRLSRDTIRSLPWRGLGAPLDAVDDGDDAPVIATLTAVLKLGTALQRAGMLAIVRGTGANLHFRLRLGAMDLRHKALMRGLVLAPWWRVRLAVRRTQTDLDALLASMPRPTRDRRTARSNR